MSPATVVMCGWLEAPILLKDVLKSASTTSGVLFVTASGEMKKHGSFVDS